MGILDVSGKEDLIITCKSGITLRTGISTIKEAGRATQGVTLIRLDEGDEIAAISKVEEIDVPEEMIVLPEENSSEIPVDNSIDNQIENTTDNQTDNNNENQ